MAEATMPYGWGRVPYGYEDRRRWMTLPFPEEEYRERMDRVRRRMRDEGLDCLVVSAARGEGANIRYLTNFEDYYGGWSLVVLPLEGEPGFATDAIMHGEPMHSGIQNCWLPDSRCAAAPRTVTGGARATTVADHLRDLIHERGCASAVIGLDAEGDEAHVVQVLAELCPRAEVRAVPGLLRRVRAIKSAREVELLRRACHIADLALEAAMEAVRPGATEHDLAAAANQAMFAAGAEHPAFAIAVTAGERAGFKHLAPSDYRIAPGDMVLVDLGAKYFGYNSDSTRNRVCGTPSGEQLRFMETQVSIAEACMEAAAPGVVIGDLARMAQEMADGAGYAEWFYFRGHGVGCSLRDLPAFAPGSTTVLKEGMVFSFEPMFIRAGFGTASWEDTWHVTAEGVERLNGGRYRWW